jgi:hypothetical protein
VNDLINEVEKITSEYSEMKKDGLTLIEILSLTLSATNTFIETAESVLSNSSGKQKQEWVVQNVRKLYMKLNLDLPWIVEPFETMLENVLLDYVVPAFINVIVNIFNSKGYFKNSKH